MYPHQIRLAGPWEQVGEQPVRMRRRFGRPRQIDDWERVWLIPVAEKIGDWRLNDRVLKWNRRGDGTLRSNVTGMLKERNEIIAEVSGEFIGAILEIGCRAFVQDVRCRADSDRGEIVSVDVVSECADDPLELYVLIDGETYGYFGPFSTNGTMTQEFTITDCDPKLGASLRVDLICRSTIWDTLESAIV